MRRFTLIELLVVVAIIAILAGLLMPGLRRSREQARRIVCMSQLRQLNVATGSYTSDFDGFLPSRNGVLLQTWSSVDGGMGGAFCFFSEGYLGGDPQLIVCPSKASPVRWIGARADLNNRWWDYRYWESGWSSYTFPAGSAPFLDLDNDHSRPWVYWVRMGRLDSDMTVFADPVIFPEWTSSYPWLQQTNHWDDGMPSGGNAVFVDGHGEWIPFSSGTTRWMTGDIASEIRWPDSSPVVGYYNLRNAHVASHKYFFGTSDLTQPSRGLVYRP